MKKFIMIALVCTIGLTMFGCQNETNSSNKSSATQVESTAPTEGTTKEKIVCTITPDGGKRVVISDERARTIYNLLKNPEKQNQAANSKRTSDGDGRIDVILTTDNDQEYYIVYEGDIVFTVDEPNSSNMHFVGYIKDIYRRISQIKN